MVQEAMSKTRAAEIILEAKIVPCTMCNGTGSFYWTETCDLHNAYGRVVGETVHPRVAECDHCCGKGRKYTAEYYAAIALLKADHD